MKRKIDLVFSDTEKSWIHETILIDYELRKDWNGYMLSKQEVKKLLDKFEEGNWED